MSGVEKHDTVGEHKGETLLGNMEVKENVNDENSELITPLRGTNSLNLTNRIDLNSSSPAIVQFGIDENDGLEKETNGLSKSQKKKERILGPAGSVSLGEESDLDSSSPLVVTFGNLKMFDKKYCKDKGLDMLTIS